jgi:serine/threonine-protein kinase
MPSTPPTTAAAPVLAAGTIVAGRYRVEELLGEGAVGAVYRVRHLHMGKELALKLLRAELGNDDEIATRFQREAVAASHIEHVNVAAATDFGRTEDGRFFLVLEHVPGHTLRSVLGEGAMRADRAVGIALQVARALVKAHGLGIIHRDLKPENVMLVARDGGDVELVKILDFGIAKVPIDTSHDVRAQPMTRLGVVYGTPGYMAPEQALGETVDGRADLYALGVVLYEMLAGVPPFPSHDPVALLGLQVSQRAPTLRERAPSIAVPAALESVVLRLLETNASDRFQTAAEVVTALESVANAALPHQPTVALAAVRPTGDVVSPGAAPPAAAWAAPHARRAIAAAKAAYEKLRAKLPERWRPAAPVVVVAVAVMAFVVVALPLVLLVGRGSTKKTLPSIDGGAAREYAAAPEASLRQAMRGGPPALEDLARDYPDDPRIQRELVRAYTADGRGAPAMRALARLLALDADAARDDEMSDALVSALSGANDAAAAAIRVAEGPFGARGVDILLECASRTGPLQDRCTQSLSKPEVRRHASPAALVLFDLRAAKECDAKRAAAERAATQGDARSLAELKTLSKRYGCGKRGRYDCWPCLRKDGFLDDVIARLEARSRRADVVDP